VFTKSHGVVRAEEDAEKSKQVLIWCRQLFNKLRKGFNKLKVREPMSQVVENDADTVSQRKDDDNLDEVGLFNIFVRGLLFVVLNSIHLEGQGRQPPAVTASRQPPVVCRHSRQPPSHLKVEISCFEFVYK